MSDLNLLDLFFFEFGNYALSKYKNLSKEHYSEQGIAYSHLKNITHEQKKQFYFIHVQQPRSILSRSCAGSLGRAIHLQTAGTRLQGCYTHGIFAKIIHYRRGRPPS